VPTSIVGTGSPEATTSSRVNRSNGCASGRVRNRTRDARRVSDLPPINLNAQQTSDGDGRLPRQPVLQRVATFLRITAWHGVCFFAGNHHAKGDNEMQGSFFWDDVVVLAASLEADGDTRGQRLENVTAAFATLPPEARDRARRALRMLLQELSDVGTSIVAVERSPRVLANAGR
jgi:hypothetical protein